MDNEFTPLYAMPHLKPFKNQLVAFETNSYLFNPPGQDLWTLPGQESLFFGFIRNTSLDDLVNLYRYDLYANPINLVLVLILKPGSHEGYHVINSRSIAARISETENVSGYLRMRLITDEEIRKILEARESGEILVENDDPTVTAILDACEQYFSNLGNDPLEYTN